MYYQNGVAKNPPPAPKHASSCLRPLEIARGEELTQWSRAEPFSVKLKVADSDDISLGIALTHFTVLDYDGTREQRLCFPAGNKRPAPCDHERTEDKEQAAD